MEAKSKNKTYTTQEIKELYEAGKFKMELLGHSLDTRAIHELEREVEFNLQCQKEHPDPEDGMYKIYRRETEPGTPYIAAGRLISHECDYCGERMYLGLSDEDTLSLFTKVKTGEGFMDFEITYKPENTCKFAEEIAPAVNTLNFEDELIFVNRFYGEDKEYIFEDCPKKLEYNDEYAMRSVAGLQARYKFQAENNNVAYGQFSNMSVGIYANKDASHIIISSPHLDEEYDREDKAEERRVNTLKFFEENGFECVGYICLDVWRVEASDRKTLDAAGFKEEYMAEYHDIVKVDIPSGEWEFTHYFDCYDFGYNFENPEFYSEMEIYSEFKLIKE